MGAAIRSVKRLVQTLKPRDSDRRRALLGQAIRYGGFLGISGGLSGLLRSPTAHARAPAAALRLATDEFLIMRHADAPGFSDPEGFRVDDCATQRNLGAQGRAQAAAIGRWLRAQGLLPMEVWTSPWCRCMDTARLLEVGEPQSKAFLGSFFRDRDLAEGHTQNLRQALARRLSLRSAPALIAVTHQVNISAYTGSSVASGEILKIRLRTDGSPREAFRIDPA